MSPSLEHDMESSPEIPQQLEREAKFAKLGGGMGAEEIEAVGPGMKS